MVPETFSRHPADGNRFPVSAAILNGGKARRFGGLDKQMLEIHGVPIGQMLASTLAALAQELLIIGRPHPIYQALGTRQYGDDEKGKGPLAGLLSSLRLASEEWVFLCAVDTPFVSPALFRYLYSRMRRGSADIVFCESGNMPQPFFALYRKSLASELARCLQDNAAMPFRHFILSQRHDIVRESELISFCDPAFVFLNINDPASYDIALREAECHGLFQSPQI